MIIPYILNYMGFNVKTIQGVSIVSGFIGLYSVIATPLGLRFRNVLFGFYWLIGCLIFISFDQYFINFWPIVMFVYYQVIRISFWIIYKLEFLPLWVGKGSIDGRFSKLENRRSKSIDKKFMYVTFIGGITLMILTIILDGLKMI